MLELHNEWFLNLIFRNNVQYYSKLLKWQKYVFYHFNNLFYFNIFNLKIIRYTNSSYNRWFLMFYIYDSFNDFFFLNKIATGISVFVRFLCVMRWGWTHPSLMCGIKWKCLAAGGTGETPRIRHFRGRSTRTKANKGVIRICPFVLPPVLKAMFPTLMPKKLRFISPTDHALERYISAR